jgi:hypothetical protein
MSKFLGIIQSSLVIKSLTLGLGKDVSLIKDSNIAPMEDVCIYTNDCILGIRY